MSAVLKPIDPSEQPRSLHASRNPLGADSIDRSTSNVRPLHEDWPTRTPRRRRPPASNTTVKQLPTRSHPAWLKGLVLAQQGSAVLMLLMVGSVLAVYGWTVYVQQTWGRTYQRLETLQEGQRQMTAAIEMLKYQTAQTVDTEGSDLVMPQPDQLIFMTPAEPRSLNEDRLTTPPVAPSSRSPIGY
jgi:hypothetical protein